MTSGRRRIGGALVGVYMVVLGLAAWRHEIRPAFFDRPATLARELLGLVGFPPGVAVFTSDAGRAADEKIRALCIAVRVVEVDGRVHALHPPPGSTCPSPPPRLWVRGQETSLYRFSVALRGAVIAHRMGELPPSGARMPRLLAESIAETFRARARAAGLTPERYALLWTESRIHYGSGRRSESTVALMRWSDASPADVFVTWRPDERALREHWPALGEP